MPSTVKLRPIELDDARILASWGIGTEEYQHKSLLKEMNIPGFSMFMCDAGWGYVRNYLDYDEIGYVVAPHLRNRGYGKAIARMLLDHTKHKRIIATIKSENTPSLRIAKSIGVEIVVS